jgi:hypothetical protein
MFSSPALPYSSNNSSENRLYISLLDSDMQTESLNFSLDEDKTVVKRAINTEEFVSVRDSLEDRPEILFRVHRSSNMYRYKYVVSVSEICARSIRSLASRYFKTDPSGIDTVMIDMNRNEEGKPIFGDVSVNGPAFSKSQHIQLAEIVYSTVQQYVKSYELSEIVGNPPNNHENIEKEISVVIEYDTEDLVKCEIGYEYTRTDK